MNTMIRTRWAAIGAAIAITLGGGGIGITHAIRDTGERPIFIPITPCRILDTRAGSAVPTRQTPLGPGETHTQPAHGTNGQCTIPADATALSLNVTAIDATTNGTYLTIWPTDQPQPNASSLNPAPGQPPTPNAVITDISPDGKFNIYNYTGTINILIDINGYYTDHNHNEQKFISIDPYGVHMQANANVKPGAPDGLSLPDSGNPAFEFGFMLPADYTTNTNLRYEVLWHINAAAGCQVQFTWNFSRISHSGQIAQTAPLIRQGDVPVSPGANLTATTIFELHPTGFDLQAGDAVLVGLVRQTDGPVDTCVGDQVITGIRMTYR